MYIVYLYTRYTLKCCSCNVLLVAFEKISVSYCVPIPFHAPLRSACRFLLKRSNPTIVYKPKKNWWVGAKIKEASTGFDRALLSLQKGHWLFYRNTPLAKVLFQSTSISQKGIKYFRAENLSNHFFFLKYFVDLPPAPPCSTPPHRFLAICTNITIETPFLLHDATVTIVAVQKYNGQDRARYNTIRI